MWVGVCDGGCMYSTNVFLLCVFADTIPNHAERSERKAVSHFSRGLLNFSS